MHFSRIKRHSDTYAYMLGKILNTSSDYFIPIAGRERIEKVEYNMLWDFRPRWLIDRNDDLERIRNYYTKTSWRLLSQVIEFSQIPRAFRKRRREKKLWSLEQENDSNWKLMVSLFVCPLFVFVPRRNVYDTKKITILAWKLGIQGYARRNCVSISIYPKLSCRSQSILQGTYECILEGNVWAAFSLDFMPINCVWIEKNQNDYIGRWGILC